MTKNRNEQTTFARCKQYLQTQTSGGNASRIDGKNRYKIQNGFVEYSKRSVAIALEAYREDKHFYYDGIFDSDFDKNCPVTSD